MSVSQHDSKTSWPAPDRRRRAYKVCKEEVLILQCYITQIQESGYNGGSAEMGIFGQASFEKMIIYDIARSWKEYGYRLAL